MRRSRRCAERKPTRGTSQRSDSESARLQPEPSVPFAENAGAPTCAIGRAQRNPLFEFRHRGTSEPRIARREIAAPHDPWPIILRIRAATFVTSSPLQLRPTYAIGGSAKRSESVQLPNGKKHLSRDSRCDLGLLSWSNNILSVECFRSRSSVAPGRF